MELHELHDDDKPVGRVLSRREMLTLLSGMGVVAVVGSGITRLVLGQGTVTPTPVLTGTAVPTCVVKPALTEGPYFVDAMLNRSDIRLDPATELMQEGVKLRLVFRVSQVSDNACTPFEGVQVDVWHCNALGVYSDIESEGSAGEQWLRGYQGTDEFGQAEFITVYPGWYQGRAVHIHFKMRTEPESEAGYEFTSQLFFDDGFSDVIFSTEEPYTEKGANRAVLNENDGIFEQSGDQLTLTVTEEEDGDGYVATFDIGIDLSQPQTESSFSGGGGRPPRP